jgi:MerR HTH family regulatory protein
MGTYHFNATREEAGKAIGIAAETVRQWERKGKIPPHCYTKIGHRTIRYCLDLVRDWALAPDDMEARARAIEALNATRPSQQPRKAGRKAA